MDLVEIPRNPIPTGAISGVCKGADGIDLRFARWSATTPRRKGTVCVFGGRGEFIEKYFETTSDLRRRGFAVACLDWRGQGGSARLLKNPQKGHVEDFADFDRDLARFMNEVVLPDCPPPFYALAHSMGANILLRAARMKDCWFDRMVLMAPMLGLTELPLPLPAVAGLAEMLTFVGLGDVFVPGGNGVAWESRPFEDNLLSTDTTRYTRNQAILQAAPDLGVGSPTIGWLRAAIASMGLINDYGYPASVHVPVLMLTAGSDRIVCNRAIQDLAAQLKAGSQIVLHGARHEILQERDELREQALAAIETFLPGRQDL
ncbi:MAG: alpha/beta hydrolase [Hyphomicrobiales bacterium]|nr:alpha/beta hydrolase [Hyphomicrobiales bacterium]